MNKFIFTCILSVAFFSAGFAQHSNNDLINKEKRSDWMNSAIAQLNNITQPDGFPLLTVKKTAISSKTRLSVKVKKEGWIQLPDHGWICIISSSSHDSPEIGDLSIAIDHLGNKYMNEGHVCGGIIHFETYELKALNNSDDFFSYFLSDTDQLPWVKITVKK